MALEDGKKTCKQEKSQTKPCSSGSLLVEETPLLNRVHRKTDGEEPHLFFYGGE